MFFPHLRIDRLRARWKVTARRNPRLTRGIAFGALGAAGLSLAFGVWFLTTLLTGLPDDEAIRRMGDMDQATAVYDRDDRLAFTIFKEQRIDVPLAAVS